MKLKLKLTLRPLKWYKTSKLKGMKWQKEDRKSDRCTKGREWVKLAAQYI